MHTVAQSAWKSVQESDLFISQSITNFLLLQEQMGLVVPWIIGFITFTSLEAVSMVYSNVLRDHVNREFDGLCKAEMAFFIVRTFTNMFALYSVMRFFHMLRAGVTWKGPEAIEL
ncbi:uncharacterized protein LOC123292688 [Chrysoperla carnea]|uniref:uncharacterized protein LOC123292688 n=1 Tax=Chrysoperla carnea TaxID=189513 RepID=UPI001D09671C|nr:uncharacterized protein LOC123292688 [Chrysoperla carnea]